MLQHQLPIDSFAGLPPIQVEPYAKHGIKTEGIFLPMLKRLSMIRLAIGSSVTVRQSMFTQAQGAPRLRELHHCGRNIGRLDDTAKPFQ
jgi:hypothetical protein